jgi:hypothetical protein
MQTSKRKADIFDIENDSDLDSEDDDVKKTIPKREFIVTNNDAGFVCNGTVCFECQVGFYTNSFCSHYIDMLLKIK